MSMGNDQIFFTFQSWRTWSDSSL